ncbi:hypothetical protein AN4209.2 [Aspergillus nidulans FGSC A4]|nr:hypothetical protein AN4209.2 [Aspergillus nidulans FGSC A4]|eukprot:XP_661813.1 hypothetical protein AN4209.2 [Aspergillus nidulans FGSC A4]
MASKAVIPFLVTMMLVTGVCNTILNKYQDMQCVRNCDSPDPKDHHLFEQPVIQTIQMFIGEMGCWLVVLMSHLYKRHLAPRLFQDQSPLLAGGYRPVNVVDGDDEDQTIEGHNDNIDPSKPLRLPDGRIPLRGLRTFLLAAPACCDIAGTTLMNVGLLFVAATLCVVVLGVALVGLAGALFGDNQGHDITQETVAAAVRSATTEVGATAQTPEAVRAVVGVLLIAAAQIFTASQFVLEEWILENYAMEPLQVVGWEGIFGFSVTVIGSIILYLGVGRTEAGRYGYFDAREGWHQVFTHKAVAISSVLIMISIGGFNFFGLSVTRTVSATSRSTIDTCRTLFIWLVSLGLGWETFKWLQVAGFALLVYGTFLFNDIVRPPLKACLPREGRGRVLLPEDPIEHN